MVGKISFAAALVLLPVSAAAQEEAPLFLRGDANGDGVVDISDAFRSLWCLFILGDCFGIQDCADAADTNDDGQINLTDAIHTLVFLFLGANRPPEPFPFCGPDPTPDRLDCWRPGACPHPEGGLVADSGCKKAAGGGAGPAECLEWSYEKGTLRVRHVDAAFICSAEIRTGFSVSAGNVSILEIAEVDGIPPPCMCLRDLDVEVTGLPGGTYEIKIYRQGETSSSLIFKATADLESEPSGSVCVPRDEYPWVQ